LKHSIKNAGINLDAVQRKLDQHKLVHSKVRKSNQPGECPECQVLKSELDRLERAHFETVLRSQSNKSSTLIEKRKRKRTGESGARLKFEAARAKLNNHKTKDHGR
jgi:hypothetical protein